MKKISIIVPVYNSGVYLHECLKSILNQSYQHFEVILINDGSTDNSGEICKEYSRSDNRIIYISQENAGQSSARNKGISLASGEYIMFVDSDDWIDKDMIMLLVERSISLNLDIVACNFFLMDENGKIGRFSLEDKNIEFTKSEAMHELLFNRLLTYSVWNKLYNIKVFENVKFKEGIILEDIDISYKLINNSLNVGYIHIPLYYYRYNRESTMRKKFSISRLDEFNVYMDMFHFFSANYQNLKYRVYYNLVTAGQLLYILIEKNIPDSKHKYDYLIRFDKFILFNCLFLNEISFINRTRIFLLLLNNKLGMTALRILDKFKIYKIN